jgi:hypothetical protein
MPACSPTRSSVRSDHERSRRGSVGWPPLEWQTSALTADAIVMSRSQLVWGNQALELAPTAFEVPWEVCVVMRNSLKGVMMCHVVSDPSGIDAMSPGPSSRWEPSANSILADPSMTRMVSREENLHSRGCEVPVNHQWPAWTPSATQSGCVSPPTSSSCSQ